MSDQEPRKRKKRKTHGRNDNVRSDSESDKGAKEVSKDSSKKSKRQSKSHPQEVTDADSRSSSSCIKCLFFMLITLLAIGVGMVVYSLQVPDSPAIFSEEVIEKIQTFINDIKPDSSPAAEYNPIISESETWEDGNKIELSDNMEEKSMIGSELKDTYGIHLGFPSSSPLRMDDFSEDQAHSHDTEPNVNEIHEAHKENILKQSEATPSSSSRQYELPQASPDDEIRTEIPIEDIIKVPDDALPSEQTDPIVNEIPSVEQHTSELPIERTEDTTPKGSFVGTGDADPVINQLEENGNQYDKIDITNEYDFLIKEELDDADDLLDQSPDRALRAYSQILKVHKHSARTLYGQARCYDLLSSIHRSNQFLDQSVAGYVDVMTLNNTPDALYILSAERAANRSLFRGMHAKAVGIRKDYARRFPRNMKVRNDLAVSYMVMGRNTDAEKILNEVLKWDPDNGFAKVHLGFILKTHYSNYKDSIKFLFEGIRSKAPGTIDGRFFYHLGDAYNRLGFSTEARQVYISGAQQGVFLSADQRSLYNVDELTGKPWWDFSKTKYANSIKFLESNWKIIKDEAISLLNIKTNDFSPESENLQDTGDWRQLELFARGRINSRHCQLAPKTCNLVKNIPDAIKCTRCQTKFSIMYPGTHVWPHTGPTNCRLRAHLGLVVPPGPRIRVANQTRSWEEGKVMVFDDSFEHEVWHSGSSYRLVLIVDFWHPDLTKHQKATLLPI